MRPSFKFCWFWIFPWMKLSWHFCSMWDKPGWLNWFWQFVCERLPSLIHKDSSTHMHGLTVYVKEGLPFAQDLSLENSADSYLCFWLALLHLVSHFFFFYQPPSSSLCMIFYSTSSNIDEVLSVNPSANAFVFKDFNIHHMDWDTWQVLCEALSFFNPKGFYDSYAWSYSLCERRTSFCLGIISRKLSEFLPMFWTGFTSLSALFLFPILITFFVFMHHF